MPGVIHPGGLHLGPPLLKTLIWPPDLLQTADPFTLDGTGRMFFFWVKKHSLGVSPHWFTRIPLKPKANLITFCLRAIWIAEENGGYFLYGVVSSPCRNISTFQASWGCCWSSFSLQLFYYQHAWFFPAGPEQRGCSDWPKGNKESPSHPCHSFLFFCPWPCVLHASGPLLFPPLEVFLDYSILHGKLSLKVLRLRSSYMKRNLLFLQLSMNSPIIVMFFHLTGL